MMTRDEIIAALRASADAFRAQGVTKLWIFGSRAREDFHTDSDLDVLIDVAPDKPFGWKSLIEVGYICEEKTGFTTQVAMRDSLKPRIRERIADDLNEAF